MSTPDEAAQRVFGPNVLHNANLLYDIKFISSCLSGAVAGILGLENWLGFALFLAATLFTTAILHFVTFRGRPKKYVYGGLLEVVNPGQENAFSFILVWTLFYGIVHVYD
ncbi:hypothetical protein FA95DRAFT_1345450 [Auriscalpium vulgare]|uniref:Uncharacterized protein n=1 Tax=Auriscalpium vulgare TaxID=40419 RepID=A0ACB8RS25_9AGAM|nr:hypothetical protein FA95DRAFT_1345450 [Auriscalpium vulgare]